MGGRVGPHGDTYRKGWEWQGEPGSGGLCGRTGSRGSECGRWDYGRTPEGKDVVTGTQTAMRTSVCPCVSLGVG